jgi:hypothetical protein
MGGMVACQREPGRRLCGINCMGHKELGEAQDGTNEDYQTRPLASNRVAEQVVA